MAVPIYRLPKEIEREVRQRKWLALMLFIVVCCGVLTAGFIWPYKYQSQVIIYVDDSNIIKPLMEGSAVTTKISDQTSSASQMLQSRAVLKKVATDTNIFGPNAASLTADQLEGRMDEIRANMSVVSLGKTKSYFAIQYTGHHQQQVYLIAQRLGQLFISESDTRKKNESREAYDFINRQVKAYEQQLQQAQENLKNFETKNNEGTEEEASKKIADLRGKIELANLDLGETTAEKKSLEQQLKGVGQTVNQGETEDVYQSRISKLQQQLDNLQLKYKDSYPDIVNLKQEIAQLEKRHKLALENKSADQVTQGREVINPLYQNLKSQLATTNAKIDSLHIRLKALSSILSKEKQRMEKIQQNKAEYAKLTRGMQVNKDIYDDLLKRREKARVSMRLDLDGEGLNYEIQESAQYPLEPVGAKFKMFASAGLLLGLIAPFGLAAAFAQVDPRIRDKAVIEDELEIPVLTVLPQVRTPFERMRDRRRTWIVAIVAVIVSAGYVSLAVLHVLGAI